jgi:hypothetical protein
MNGETSNYIPNFTDAGGKPVSGSDVTETFGKFIADKLLSDPTVMKMNFPRLRLPRLSGLGYSSGDYHKIANLILSQHIKVYETQGTEKIDFLGVYQNTNRFIFAKKLTESPETHFGTIVHEVTHAIQDLKKWRESDRDREVDAHFAGALFMVLKNQENFLKSTKYGGYINLAKAVKENPGYYKSFEFGKKVSELKNTIMQEYGWKYRDEPGKLDDFQKRQRWDGIAT